MDRYIAGIDARKLSLAAERGSGALTLTLPVAEKTCLLRVLRFLYRVPSKRRSFQPQVDSREEERFLPSGFRGAWGSGVWGPGEIEIGTSGDKRGNKLRVVGLSPRP